MPHGAPSAVFGMMMSPGSAYAVVREPATVEMTETDPNGTVTNWRPISPDAAAAKCRAIRDAVNKSRSPHAPLPRPRFEHPEPDRADRRHRHAARWSPTAASPSAQRLPAVQVAERLPRRTPIPRVKHSDPLMWVEALELLLGELRARGRRSRRACAASAAPASSTARSTWRVRSTRRRLDGRPAAGRPGAPAAVARDGADLDGQRRPAPSAPRSPRAVGRRRAGWWR